MQVYADANGRTISRTCLRVWDQYGLPAAETACDLVGRALGELKRNGRMESAGILEARLGLLEVAFERMTAWTARQPSDDWTEGVSAFDAWYRAYAETIREILQSEARRDLRLGGSALIVTYSRWRRPHCALRDLLSSPDAGADGIGRLADEPPFRQLLLSSQPE